MVQAFGASEAFDSSTCRHYYCYHNGTGRKRMISRQLRKLQWPIVWHCKPRVSSDYEFGHWGTQLFPGSKGDGGAGEDADHQPASCASNIQVQARSTSSLGPPPHTPSVDTTS